MATFWKPNLERDGRTWRGLLGTILFLTGIAAAFWQLWLGGLLIASGTFVLFEAVRGWCLLRACGIKTRL
jgi:hypothetical protein